MLIIVSKKARDDVLRCLVLSTTQKVFSFLSERSKEAREYPHWRSWNQRILTLHYEPGLFTSPHRRSLILATAAVFQCFWTEKLAAAQLRANHVLLLPLVLQAQSLRHSTTSDPAAVCTHDHTEWLLWLNCKLCQPSPYCAVALIQGNSSTGCSPVKSLNDKNIFSLNSQDLIPLDALSFGCQAALPVRLCAHYPNHLTDGAC